MSNPLEKYLFTLNELKSMSKEWSYNAGSDDSGLYFLFNNDDLVYVGQATLIFRRLNDHASSSKIWQRFSCIEIADKDYKDMMEGFYIGAYWPIYNNRPEIFPDFLADFLPLGARAEQQTQRIAPLQLIR